MKKGIKLIAFFAATCLLTGCNNGKEVLEYQYEDNNVPGTKYEITLYDSKQLVVKETEHCNYEKCKDKTEKNQEELTQEEYDKVLEITKESYNKEMLSQALSSLAKGDDIKASFEKDGKENWEGLYQEDDLNNNKVLTYREYGNSLLNKIVEEGNQR